MCTAVTTSMPRTGVSGTRKPCWKDRSIPSAPFAALKRRTQLLRTDTAAKSDKRIVCSWPVSTVRELQQNGSDRGNGGRPTYIAETTRLTGLRHSRPVSQVYQVGP